MERVPPTAMMREMMMSMKLWKAVILLRRDGATEKMGLLERKRLGALPANAGGLRKEGLCARCHSSVTVVVAVAAAECFGW
ncbi:hypothetical protein QYF36_020024 [Acer negundo]|nr:hypothetical protein QYF36_020024 [Acer negundo]